MSRIWRVLRAHPIATASIAAVGIYLLIALLLTWPIGPFDASHLPDAGTADQGSAIWGIEWVAFAMRHGLNVFHTDYIDFPTGANLAETPPAPLLGFIASPITYGLGPIAAYNALVVFGLVSSATSMFVVLHRWCRRLLPAFLGGLFFGFNPYAIAQVHKGGHIIFLTLGLLPLMLWCLNDLFIAHRHRAWKVGLLLGGLGAAQSLISLEVFGDVAIAIVVGLVVAFVMHPRTAFAHCRKAIGAIVPAIVIFVPVLGWQLWWVLFAPDHIVGPTQPTFALQDDRVNLFGAITPLTNQLVAPQHFAKIAAGWVQGNFPENGSYLGITLILFLIGICIVCRKEIIVRFAVGLALVTYILSLGNRLDFGNRTTSIPLPEALLPRVSLFSNSLPARFSLVVALFVAVALGVGIDRLLDRAAAKNFTPRRVGVMAVVLGIVVSVPILPRGPIATQTLAWPNTAVTAMQAMPEGSTVLAYPYPFPGFPEPMAWQALSGMHVKLVGGYANMREPNGTSSIEAPLLLDPPYVEEALSQAQFGGYWYTFKPVGNPTTVDKAALCTFIRRYNIGGVVAWDTGSSPEFAANYFISVLGGADINTGVVLAWINPVNHCPAA